MATETDPVRALQTVIAGMNRFRRVTARRKILWWALAIIALAAHAVWAFRSGQVVHLQRGGAMLTMFAFFMLFFTRGLPQLAHSVIETSLRNLPAMEKPPEPTAGTTGIADLQSRLNRLEHDLPGAQALADLQNLHIALIGTLGTFVWGYGDLLACLPLGLNGCPG